MRNGDRNTERQEHEDRQMKVHNQTETNDTNQDFVFLRY